MTGELPGATARLGSPPGESDGQCRRGLSTGDNVMDPIWGQVDPDAGGWFPEQALELARLAGPPLR